MYFKDDLPTTQNAIATITVCKVDFASTCTENHTIRVKKCNPHLVFELKSTPSCNSAYCFGECCILSSFIVSKIHIVIYSINLLKILCSKRTIPWLLILILKHYQVVYNHLVYILVGCGRNVDQNFR